MNPTLTNSKASVTSFAAAVPADKSSMGGPQYDPWALDFEGASPEMEFLKLDEELDETKFKEDWQAFFYGTGRDRTDKPQRGFFSFYPVQRAKQGSIGAEATRQILRR